MPGEVTDVASATKDTAASATIGTIDAASPPAPIGITSEQLKARLDETRKAERDRVLKELGVESLSAATERFKKAKELEDAQLSEKEMMTKELDELRPLRDLAQANELIANAALEEQLLALPEDVQKAIAEDADTASERLAMLRIAKVALAIQRKEQPAMPPVTGAPRAPATTAAPPHAPAGAGAPATADHKAKWEAKRAAGETMEAALYLLKHQKEIYPTVRTR